MTCERHTTANCRPLWRSDLCGPHLDKYTGGATLAAFQCFTAHGWWCPDCEAETPAPESLPMIGGEPAHRRWWVRLTRGGEVEIHAFGVLGPELPKLACAIEAAHRMVQATQEARTKRELGQVGWFASDTSPLTIWHWPHLNMQVGAVLAGIRPRSAQTCEICRSTIRAGASCWRPASTPRSMTGMGASPRFCARCVAGLPRSPLAGSRPAPTIGRALPDLRVV